MPFPSPGNLPNPGTELGSPALQADSLLSEALGKNLSYGENKDEFCRISAAERDLFLFCCFGCTHAVWDLNSPTRDQTCTPCIESVAP